MYTYKIVNWFVKIPWNEILNDARINKAFWTSPKKWYKSCLVILYNIQMSTEAHFHFSFISNRLFSMSHFIDFQIQRDEYHAVFHFLHGFILSGGFDLQWSWQFPYAYEQNQEYSHSILWSQLIRIETSLNTTAAILPEQSYTSSFLSIYITHTPKLSVSRMVSVCKHAVATHS